MIRTYLAPLPLLLAAFLTLTPSQAHATRGVLVIAHGKGDHGHGIPAPEGPWEKAVREAVESASQKLQEPVDLAFGMWSRSSFEKGVQRLEQRGATEIRVIPLFISSHSDVIRAQHYQFGLRPENPLPFEPGKIRLPSSITQVSFSPCLDDSAELGQILVARARELIQNPSAEEMILVAHGPLTDEDEELWFKDLSVHSQRITQAHGIPASALTVRDDAEEDIRNEMTRRLRAKVEAIRAQGKTALILPVLLAPGGIEAGILERLSGLSYRYSGHMISPDPLLSDWIVRMAK